MAEFKIPPRTTNHEGGERRVGVELEMARIRAEDMAAAVTDCLGGVVERESSFVSHVRGTLLGDFRIELDAEVLKSRSYLEHLARLGVEVEPGDLRDNLEDVLSRVAGLVVPHELVCPPIPFSQLATLDRVRKKLHESGARGTQSSPFYAFGLQLNVEIWDQDVQAILPVLQAFFIHYERLLEASRVDLARKLSPYVQPFPEDYVARVLDPDYDPDLESLIDDFLQFTPTRNRPLDPLPLFAWLAKEQVMAAPVEHDLIKARPAWHYRLPNCLVDDPDWDLAMPWNDWVEVERLAADPERIRSLAGARLAGSSDLRRWLSGVRRRLGNWFRS